MNRRKSLVAPLLAIFLVAIAPGLALAASKPNILLIVSDDTGWGDLGVYGGGEGRGMPTPNIDRMAAGGTRFDRAYTNCPI